MFDPTVASEFQAREGWQGAPLGSSFRLASAPAALAPAAIEPSTGYRPAPSLRPSPAAEPVSETARLQAPPLPVPRPSEFQRARAPEPQRMADRRGSRRTGTAGLPAGTADTPSFFEELFGVRKPAGPALAYAALESDTIETARPGRLFPAPVPSAQAGTAVYDISARTVRLPNGAVLEAHSGLGRRLDDPSAVHLRMRGATPPGTYDLTEREQLFHGVRALRLNPVGGSAAIYGRDGLLAHTYMLGPNGDSNGCVSFKDYNAFLQAYLRGEVRRLVVVSGRGLDGPPRPADSRFGMLGRSGARPADG